MSVTSQNRHKSYRHIVPQEEVENPITYVMEGIGSFVHSTIQQFGDAELLYAPSYFIGSATQDVICLEEEEEVFNLCG